MTRGWGESASIQKDSGPSAEPALSAAERAREDTRTRNAEQNLKSRAVKLRNASSNAAREIWTLTFDPLPHRERGRRIRDSSPRSE